MTSAGAAPLPRVPLATLPTPLERGPEIGGVRVWIKRDDLTGLGLGGNKARKLEYLCGEALAAGADCLITSGAAQSNHCRITAAAGAMLGLETHLVLSGERPAEATGNQLLAAGFGAHLHFTGTPADRWGELEVAREALTEELAAQGLHPYSIPIGGSTAVGATGYLVAYDEIAGQCAAAGIRPVAIVHASSSGGTHAGLLAGWALRRAAGSPRSGVPGTPGPGDAPEVLAVAVSLGVARGSPDVHALAAEVLALAGHSPDLVVPGDVVVEDGWLGDGYGVPSAQGDGAVAFAACRGGWVLDRTYTAKAFAAVLAWARAGRWGAGSDVVFVHTGGHPAVFAPGGWPDIAAMGPAADPGPGPAGSVPGKDDR